MTRILLETLNVPAIYVAFQAVLSVFALRRTASVIMDSELWVAPELHPILLKEASLDPKVN